MKGVNFFKLVSALLPLLYLANIGLIEAKHTTNLPQHILQPAVPPISGPLNYPCPVGAARLVLKFLARSSWPSKSGFGLIGCESVQQLTMTGWQGPELESGHTAQLPSLTVLQIQDGFLSSIGSRICSSSGGNLQEIKLARNRISDLHPQSLAGCSRLESLDLSDNQIGSLPDGFLTDCGSLKALNLNGNQLSQLGPQALMGAGSLVHFQAMKNRFMNLSKVDIAFTFNRKLKIIDLQNNLFFTYEPANQDSWCGPDNVTVRLQHPGCAPSPTRSAGGCQPTWRPSYRCFGISAQVVVTFTSCQVAISSLHSQCPTAGQLVGPLLAGPPTETGGRETESQAITIRQLGLYPEGVWLLYTLAGSVLFCLTVLVVCLIVCYRLRLQIVKLQALSWNDHDQARLKSFQPFKESRNSLANEKDLGSQRSRSQRVVEGASQSDDSHHGELLQLVEESSVEQRDDEPVFSFYGQNSGYKLPMG